MEEAAAMEEIETTKELSSAINSGAPDSTKKAAGEALPPEKKSTSYKGNPGAENSTSTRKT